MKRPLSVTIISWLFIAAGAIGFVYHVTEFKSRAQFDYYLAWVCILRLLAILFGLYTLRGRNWARWLLLVWLAYHAILGAFHSLSEVATHILLLVVIAFFLFRPRSTAYFLRLREPGSRRRSPESER